MKKIIIYSILLEGIVLCVIGTAIGLIGMGLSKVGELLLDHNTTLLIYASTLQDKTNEKTSL
jgi:hypothetical protein